MTEPSEIAGLLFLIVAVGNFVSQTITLRQLIDRGQGDSVIAYQGLLRTSRFRVMVAVLYIFVGIDALWVHIATSTFTLSAFCVTQLLWIINGRADVALRRRMSIGVLMQGRHRRR